ncbi:hypothetical protein SKAU_G00309290 [Synaphobranchus kaupii]|uniref:Uncharacterized protein n=1 Tax=Synaphobranchus kaupii TaxID=118154 RepID=A0A9Q1IL74_SYNKA|nr:hypothetical protein SKAU_G00309290 [Synaphobranchus kaupii]
MARGQAGGYEARWCGRDDSRPPVQQSVGGVTADGAEKVMGACLRAVGGRGKTGAGPPGGEHHFIRAAREERSRSAEFTERSSQGLRDTKKRRAHEPVAVDEAGDS